MAKDRLQTEQTFHDRQARARAETFSRDPEQWRFLDDAYLDHESWVRPAFAQLGQVQGKNVLDLGCGHAMAAVVMARRGAQVTAVDLSLGYLREGESRAKANGVAISFVQANAEKLPFPDASFDALWGMAILHHLDIDQATLEMARVLRPGGVAVCSEPWGENPILTWARKKVFYPGKGRTPDEQPLRAADLNTLRKVFPVVEARGYQLLSMLQSRRHSCKRTRLDWCDEMLLKRVPALRNWCRYMVLTLRR